MGRRENVTQPQSTCYSLKERHYPGASSFQLSVLEIWSRPQTMRMRLQDLLGTPKDKDPLKEPSQIDGTLAMQKIPTKPKGPRLIFAIRLNDTFRPEVDMLDHFTD
jgi:hypothetical protein